MKQRLFISRHRLWQVATDTVLVFAALLVAFLWRFDFSIPWRYSHLLWTVIWWMVATKVVTFVAFGLYNKWWRYSGVRDLTHIIQAIQGRSDH